MMTAHDKLPERIKEPDEPGMERNGFVCPVCGRALPREGALLRHERTHQPERGRSHADEEAGRGISRNDSCVKYVRAV
jgi:hypothetical protein